MNRFDKNILKELDDVIDYNIKWVMDCADSDSLKYYVDRAYEFVSGYATCLIKHKVFKYYKSNDVRKRISAEIDIHIHERVRLYDYGFELSEV